MWRYCGATFFFFIGALEIILALSKRMRDEITEECAGSADARAAVDALLRSALGVRDSSRDSFLQSLYLAGREYGSRPGNNVAHAKSELILSDHC